MPIIENKTKIINKIDDNLKGYTDTGLNILVK